MPRQHVENECVRAEMIDVERLVRRPPEQQVFAERRVHGKSVFGEDLDRIAETRRPQSLVQNAARAQQAVRHSRTIGLRKRAEPGAQEICFEADQPHDIGDTPVEIRAAGEAEAGVIDPVGCRIDRRVARGERLPNPDRALPRLVGGKVRGADRPMLRSVEQVVAPGAAEDMAVLVDIAEAIADLVGRQRSDIAPADPDRADGRPQQAAQKLRQLGLAAARRADDGEPSRHGGGERDIVEKPAIAFDEGDARNLQRPRKGQRAALGALCFGKRALGRGHEIFDQCGILHPVVLELLVVLEQVVPGLHRLAIGGDHGDQRPDRQVAHDHQIAADEIEQEGRELREEAVEEDDRIAELVEPAADAEQYAEPIGGPRPLEDAGVVGMDLPHAGDRFRDVAGEQADIGEAAAAFRVHPLLQLRHEERLKGEQGDRGKAEHPVLHEQEGHRGRERAGLQHRVGHRDPHVAAERLGLGRRHGHHLARADAPEVRQRKTQDLREQVVAQAAQHDLAEHALLDAEGVAQAGRQQHQRQQRQAEQDEIVHLAHRHAPERLARECARRGLERAVDDHLRQLEEGVQQRQVQQRPHDEDELLFPAIAPDIGEDAAGNGRCLQQVGARPLPAPSPENTTRSRLSGYEIPCVGQIAPWTPRTSQGVTIFLENINTYRHAAACPRHPPQSFRVTAMTCSL